MNNVNEEKQSASNKPSIPVKNVRQIKNVCQNGEIMSLAGLVGTIALVSTLALLIYIIYLMFFKKNNKDKNNLGSAKLGNAKNLSGLTGNDGMLLSKTVQLSSNTCFEHIAIIGPTGSGKSSTFFYLIY